MKEARLRAQIKLLNILNLGAMVIISNYELQHIEKSIYSVKSNEDMPVCPCCGGSLRYRDRKLRVWMKEGGEKQYIKVRRHRCSNLDCLRYHQEIPDCIVPYKHYDSEVISGVLDGIVQEEDLDAEDYPCVSTMLRWMTWFQANIPEIENYIQKFGHNFIEIKNKELTSDFFYLQILQESSDFWLEKIIQIIYNNDGFLVPVY